jgi:inner membrane protein
VVRADGIPFALQVQLNGGDRIAFTPTGEVTEVDVSSSWPSPSFDGAFLEEERY